jgi:hypothetical protein
MIDFLRAKPKMIQSYFLEEYQKIFGSPLVDSIDALNDESLFARLTDEWYGTFSLDIYHKPTHFIGLIDCYLKYSRKYIRELTKLNLKINSFVDVGCGLGYSTMALKQVYPNAQSYGTNLKNSQWKFCETLDFNLKESVDGIGHVDMVFASEYFEHIKEPLAHLKTILDETTPKYLVIANSFNTRSAGHYRIYHAGINESKMSRIFNNFVKDNGFKKFDTGFWNCRPTVWEKIES